MAATIDIEIESGVFTGTIHRHQGYYAGDFSQRLQQTRQTKTARRWQDDRVAGCGQALEGWGPAGHPPLLPPTAPY